MTDPRDRYNVRLETDEDAQRRSAGSVHHGGSFKKYMEGKNRKLREQFAAEACAGQSGSDEDPVKSLLRGISIHVNGFTKPSHQARLWPETTCMMYVCRPLASTLPFLMIIKPACTL